MNKIFKKIMILLEGYGLLLLVAFTLTSFLMSCVESYSSSKFTFSSLLTAVETTLLQKSSEVGGWGKIMHLFASATIFWAAIRIYVASGGFKWDEFASRYLARNHLVIIGGHSRSSGVEISKARTILSSELAMLLSKKNDVVLCLPSLAQEIPRSLWEAGVAVLKKDYLVSEILEATGAPRARLVILMRDSVNENITLTRAVLSLALDSELLSCMCMVEPRLGRSGFKIHDYLEPEMMSRVRVFSDAELIARRVLRDYPPDLTVAHINQSVHVMLVGMGSIGQAIILQLARIGHYRSGLRPKVTIVDQHATARWQELSDSYPAISHWLEVKIEEKKIESIQSSDVEVWLGNEAVINVAYVCIKNELVNLRISQLLVNCINLVDVRNKHSPNVVALDPPGGLLLRDLANNIKYQDHLKLFSLFDFKGLEWGAGNKGGFLWEIDDERARKLHESYCATDDAECKKDPSRIRAQANRPWDELDESLRESNRLSADHFEVKMRAVGRQIIMDDSAEEALLTSDELELLARMEHNRWWAERSLNGWTFAENQFNAQKLHPNLVPYENLSTQVQDKDRKNILDIIKIIKGDSGVLIKT
jgi:hypothetical protein